MKRIILILISIFISTNVFSQNYNVTSLADAGAGTLREGINNVGAGGTITFDATIANGTINLTSDHLAINKSNFTIDGGTRNITINASGLSTLSTATVSKHVFYINSGSNITIQNLTITGAPLPTGYVCGQEYPLGTGGGIGVFLRPGVTNVTIQGNYIHTNSSHGIFLEQNNTGVVIRNNTISNNCQNGIQVNSGGTGVSIKGNKVGTNIAGTAAFGNYWDGIVIDQADGFTIGATAVATAAVDRNIVSGNGKNIPSPLLSQATDRGIRISNSKNGTIGFNYVGTDVTGTVAIGNARHGIFLHSPWAGTPAITTSNNLIIGNLISSNGTLASGEGHGISLADERTINNRIETNIIGTNITGTSALGNKNDGVSVFFAGNNTIGGALATQGNLISGNNFGVFLQAYAVNNVVQNNLIGTNALGTSAIPNRESGVIIQGGYYSWITWTTPLYDAPSTGNQILNNLISGNTLHGVIIKNGTFPDGTSVLPTTNNVVRGNKIGVATDGIAPLANGSNGVVIEDRASGNTIGGSTAAQRNIIAYNTDNGIHLTDGSFSNNIYGNYIGVDINQAPAPNGLDGIFIQESNTNNIGSTTAGTGNVISSNTNNGIQILNGSNNILLNNYIGTTTAGNANRANGQSGIYITESGALTSTGNRIGDPATSTNANYIAYNSNGILIDNGARINPIRKNSIYCNAVKGIELVSVGAGGGNDYYATPMTAPVFDATRQFLNGSGAGPNAIVEIFRIDAVCLSCQGKTYINQVTADGSGNWTYNFGAAEPLANANSYVVTATQQGAAPQNTSEFSDCSTLPVSIITFNAFPSAEETTVTWTYSTEDHVTSFDLYGSSDGFSFELIHTYNVVTTSPLASSSYADKTGYSYYKIIAYYPTGKTTSHGPINSTSESILTWYPNPASNEITIKTVETTSINITDIKGNTIMKLVLETGEHKISLDGILSGMYLISCQGSYGVSKKSLIVIK
ncbi:MAG: right-handed parallel beta-helix repeat-containing protein [Cytophagaceae bacterium]